MGLTPKMIRVGPASLNPGGLLCTNAFGASQFSPANWDKLSKVFPFQLAAVQNAPTAGTAAGGPGPRPALPASLPVSEVQLVTEAERDRKESIAGVSRVLGGSNEKLMSLLGSTLKSEGTSTWQLQTRDCPEL